jgi:hypothetical protein
MPPRSNAKANIIVFWRNLSPTKGTILKARVLDIISVIIFFATRVIILYIYICNKQHNFVFKLDYNKALLFFIDVTS